MAHLWTDPAYPKSEAPDSSCSAKREAIQRANAAYLVSHGLHPVEPPKVPEPSEGRGPQ